MFQPSLFDAPRDTGNNRQVRFRPDFAQWQRVARELLQQRIPPEAVWWQPDPLAPQHETTPTAGLRIDRDFPALARYASCHRSEDRWALLYRIAWRLTHGEPHLLKLASDADVLTLNRYAKAVRRDRHKMKAFVRFRAVAEPGFDTPRYVAWFEPEHLIVELTADFFRERFSKMRWSILTPEVCAHWEGHGRVWFSAGVEKHGAPRGDAMEQAWLTYYASIFNPARLKLAAMRSEMPQKYWKNLPEARLIGQLTARADARVAGMTAAPQRSRRLRCGTRPETPRETLEQQRSAAPRGSLERLRHAAQSCTACPLHATASQTVFGEGDEHAALMLIGEQPGDIEDIAGRPFMGPAGRLLGKALAAAQIDRKTLYLTNAVKHFKFKPRGKRRLHQRPDVSEMRACNHWLAQEIACVQPRVLLALGATAAHALLGQRRPLHELRGTEFAVDGRILTVSYHPAYILRLTDTARQRQAFGALCADLQRAHALAGEAQRH